MAAYGLKDFCGVPVGVMVAHAQLSHLPLLKRLRLYSRYCGPAVALVIDAVILDGTTD